jgi:hypothetical protein
LGITIHSKVRPFFSLNAVGVTLSAILFFLIPAQAQQPLQKMSDTFEVRHLRRLTFFEKHLVG